MRYRNETIALLISTLLTTLIIYAPATLARQSAQSMQVAQATGRNQIVQIVVQHLTRNGGTAQAQVTRVKIVGN